MKKNGAGILSLTAVKAESNFEAILIIQINFKTIFDGDVDVSIFRWMFNSFFVGIAATSLVIFVDALAML
jgi:ABC-type glycerol-3-phosphate transport system permease component